MCHSSKLAKKLYQLWKCITSLTGILECRHWKVYALRRFTLIFSTMGYIFCDIDYGSQINFIMGQAN